MKHRQCWTGLARAWSGLILVAVCALAHAEYPDKPITIYNPFPPGGATDALVRALGPALSRDLHQPVIIENLGGAGGTIGMSRVAGSSPDGYSLLFNNVAQSVAAKLYNAKGLDPITSFEPVGMVAFVPMVLVSAVNFPSKDLRSLLERAAHEKLSIATSGLGSATQLCSMLIMNATHTTLMPVPYKGAGAAMVDVLAGRVDLLCDQPPGTVSFIKGGKMRAYAIATKRRLPILPDVPTFAEAGLPDFEVASWHGLYAPKGTSAAVTARLSKALQQALQDPALKALFEQIGAQIVTPQQATPAALRDYLRQDVDRWTPLIKNLDITNN
jgi:tripartite-type tricarboxylate transporter receptor subunit TctC